MNKQVYVAGRQVGKSMSTLHYAQYLMMKEEREREARRSYEGFLKLEPMIEDREYWDQLIGKYIHGEI